MGGSPMGLATAAVALAPDVVLRLLADAAGVQDGGSACAVSLYLSGGQVLHGDLVRVGSDHGRDVVVLTCDGELVFAVLAGVAAVKVRDPQAYQDVLSGGALPLPASGPPVTRLALRRDFPATASFPLRLDWSALPESPQALANLARLLSTLRLAVDAVLGDELGRRAWAAVPNLVVAHEAGRALSLRRVADGVSVVADLAAALPRGLDGELRSQLNAVL